MARREERMKNGEVSYSVMSRCVGDGTTGSAEWYVLKGKGRYLSIPKRSV